MVKFSKYQKNIFTVYNTTNKNMFIEADPGSGKSFTILELAKQTPRHKSSIMLAFNKSIAEELKTKVPAGVDVSTIHSLAFKVLRKNVSGNFKLQEIKNWIIGKKILPNYFPGKDQKKQNAYLFTISRLVDLYRMNLADKSEASITKLADDYNVEYKNKEIKDAIKLINYLEKYNSKDHQGSEILIDFTDMLWLASNLVEEEDFPKYDVVFVDECLPYYMPILLTNGKSLPIGEIVDKKLKLEVLTYNTKTKKQENKKIIGWNRSLNNKKMYKIKGHNKSNHNIRSFVVCTYNHKIYVKDKGFIYSENIKPEMIIQHETSAYKTQKYKITKKGAEVVRKTMIQKNNNPLIIKPIGKSGDNLKNGSKDRGGNGKINELQLLFYNDIIKETNSKDWEIEGVVTTDKISRIQDKVPNHYKVDICNRNNKIAIELDGSSHAGERLIQDNKKDNFLRKNGWIVKRIKNNDLVKKYDEILNHIKNNNYSFCYDDANCIVDLIVESIEEIETKDNWVYDIEVEDNHNFYANGILVHNCQDLNPLQKSLIMKLVKKRGRFIAVGDSKQSIYSFQGSSLKSFNEFKNYPNTEILPLSVCYRCGSRIIEEANKVFPGTESFEENKEGIVRAGHLSEVKPGDMVICRNNLPLIETYLKFLELGKRSHIMGRDFGKSLLAMIDKIDDISDFERMLKEKVKELQEKGVSQPYFHKSFGALKEKVEIIKILLVKNQNSLEKVSKLLNFIFSEKNTQEDITLLTIHKSKGLESSRIFWLFPELVPSEYAKTELELYQEKCLRYVCLTRAKQELVYIYKPSDEDIETLMDDVVNSDVEKMQSESNLD